MKKRSQNSAREVAGSSHENKKNKSVRVDLSPVNKISFPKLHSAAFTLL